MTDIVAFIEARIAEDEAAARPIPHGEWRHEISHGESNVIDSDNDMVSFTQYDARVNEHIARHDPARVLPQAEVFRALLHVHRPEESIDRVPVLLCQRDQIAQMWGRYPCDTVRLLASIWRTHPDYQAEWAPAEEGARS